MCIAQGPALMSAQSQGPQQLLQMALVAPEPWQDGGPLHGSLVSTDD